MHDVDCLDCGSEMVKVMAHIGSTTLYSCIDCGFKFSDSDVEFEEDLGRSRAKTRRSPYDEDDDDEAY